MIITQNSHGLAPDEGDILHDYVFRDELKPPRLVGVFNMIGRTPKLAMRAMEMMRDASRASIAFQHITINPKHNLSEQERDLTVSRILEVLGAEDHGYVLVEHFKGRAVAERADHHFHLVLAHVGPNLKALDMSHSYARLEAVARSLELDFGEELTPTTRPEAVAYFARAMGRDDVADRVSEMLEDNAYIVVPFKIGAVDRQEDNWDDIDINGGKITAAAEEGLTSTSLSDAEISAPSSNCQLLEAPDISGDEGLHNLQETPSWAVDPNNRVDCLEGEIRLSGSEVEMTAAIGPAFNRDDAMSLPSDSVELTPTSTAEDFERRDDASTGRIGTAIREVSPTPTAETTRIRIVQRLDAQEKRLQDKLLILRTPADEPEKLTMARSVLDAAKARLQDALKREEMARNEVAALDGQRPNSLIAKITGKAAKFAARYDEAKKRRADAMKDLRFAQSQFDRSSVAMKAAEERWKAEQREIQRERDQEVARIGFELQRIAQIRAILEQNPELALHPKQLIAMATRDCERQAVDIGWEAPGCSPRPPS